MTPSTRTARALALASALVPALPALAANHALLIGVSDYQAAGLPSLPGALTDLELMAAVLQERLGLAPGDIRVLRDAQASHVGVRQAFRELADAVAPGDFVYIHYSGHGSLVPDRNGDGERGGKDQTLVTYAARTGDAQGDDRYDVLDDQLNAWLAPIAEKAGELVYVADSCHSATNTRGAQAPVARAAPAADQDDHPYSRLLPVSADLGTAVLVGAARDDQSAHELNLDDGRPAGAFTANWARALRLAEPGDSWRRVFDRAAVWTRLAQGTGQQPQISGRGADYAINGGRVIERAGVPVTAVRGARVTLDAGSASGVTPGSVYATSDDPEAPRVRITQVGDRWSAGTLESPGAGPDGGSADASEASSQGAGQGSAIGPGDLLFEIERAYVTAPLRIAALGSPEGAPEDETAAADAALLARALARVIAMRGFEAAASPGDADLLLALVRPRRDAGVARFREQDGVRDSLPIRDPTAAPEVWVLGRGEHLVHDRLAVGLEPEGPGLTALEHNLDTYRYLIDLDRVVAAASGMPEVRLVRLDPCEPGSLGCQQPDGTDLWLRRVPGDEPLGALGDSAGLPEGSTLSFLVRNPGNRDRHLYLFEITPGGAVRAIFPVDEMQADEARIPAGGSLDLWDQSRPPQAGLILDAPGEPALLALATSFPIDYRLLERQGYVRHRGASSRARTGAGLNALERLLVEVSDGSVSRGGLTVGSGTWGGSLVRYRVRPADHPAAP